MALKLLTDALPLYGVTSDEGQQILDHLKKLGKLAQPGDLSPAAEMTTLQKQMLAAQQAARTQKSLAQPGAAGAAGGAPPTPGAPPAQAAQAA